MGTQMTVTALIHAIGQGELILPEFQRGYTWNATQVREYLTSLYRGYPTGSFLIWKTENPGLIRGATNGNGNKAFQLILDGQQRLTSVFALVTGEPPPFYEEESLYFNIHFNVKSQDFSYYSRALMKDNPEWLPVTPFLQVGIGEYLKVGGSVEPDRRDFLMSFFDHLVQLDRIKSYAYYLDVLTERNMDEAVYIFNLVNSKGTRLSKSDLALSHICASWPEARRTMREAQVQLKALGFSFPLDFFVRATSSVATGAGYYEPLYKTSSDDIRHAWTQTREAIEYLVNILRFDAFIDSDHNLPTDMVLVPLIVYLANKGGRFSSEREKRSFLHWMYSALMWGRYSGSTETKLQQDLEALKEDDPPRKLRENILSERGRIQVQASDLESATSTSPFFTMCYVVARAAGAADWFSGLPLYSRLIGQGNGLEYHHIFPQSLLYKKGGYDSGSRRDRNRVNELANIAFLTKKANRRISNAEPSKCLAGVLEEYPKALKQQEVPQKWALWILDRYSDFLQEGRQRLADAINGFLQNLLEEQDEHTLGIEDYIKAGESDVVEFKGSLRWDYRQQQVSKALEKSVARTIAGFMNGRGGTLVMGVSDEGQIIGLEPDYGTLGSRPDRDGWEQALVNVLNAHLSKEVAALVETSFSNVDGKTVAVLHADPSRKPAFLTDGNSAEFYVRSGNTTQQLDVKQANEYIRTRFLSVV